jgi:hypothetical protein
MAKSTATVQTPQIIATVTHHVSCDQTRTCREFNVTLYPWRLSAAREYTDRPTDKRQHGRNVHIKSTSTHVPDILFAQE